MTGEPPRDKWTLRDIPPAARQWLQAPGELLEPETEPEPSRLRLVAVTWAQIAIVLVLVVGLSSLVLLTAYRSNGCGDRHKETRWSFVAPWEDPPRDCTTNRSGLTFLRDELGL
jgi:hypothetical protein